MNLRHLIPLLLQSSLCFTAAITPTQKRLYELCQEMGAQCSPNFTKQVTHLISTTVLSEKYQVSVMEHVSDLIT